MISDKESRVAPIRSAVASGQKTAQAVVEEVFAKIDAAAEYHPVLEVARERALERAATVDSRIAAGEPAGRLAGVPFIAKDNILTFSTKTTAASAMLKDFVAPYQATVIERLEAEGAIMVAKANLDAFAHGSSTENSDFGATKNPVDTTRVPGGSSGGSAAAVALDLVPFALGTDTGGSIRQPASYTGVIGLKPTYGTVSRYGVVAMASSTDVVGVLSRSVYDAQLVYDIMGGKDERDATSHNAIPVTEPILLGGLRVGVIRQHMAEGVQPGVKAAVLRTIEKMAAAGAEIHDVDMPELDHALAVYYVVVPAEISSNLSRYDGIKFGHHAEGAADLQEMYQKSRSEGFGDEAKRRIMIGTYVLSSGYYDAYYQKAQKVRTLIVRSFEQAFATYDILVGPTAPSTAFRLGQNSHDPMQMYLNDIMTVGVSLVGLPAVSIPVGEDEGLPIGMQFIAPQKLDSKLLAVADQVAQLLGENNS